MTQWPLSSKIYWDVDVAYHVAKTGIDDTCSKPTKCAIIEFHNYVIDRNAIF
jgi:hypothetical protein